MIMKVKEKDLNPGFPSKKSWADISQYYLINKRETNIFKPRH